MEKTLKEEQKKLKKLQKEIEKEKKQLEKEKRRQKELDEEPDEVNVMLWFVFFGRVVSITIISKLIRPSL